MDIDKRNGIVFFALIAALLLLGYCTNAPEAISRAAHSWSAPRNDDNTGQAP